MATQQIQATAVGLGPSESPLAAGQPAQRSVARGPDGTIYAVFPDAPGGSLQCVRSQDGRSWQGAWQSETIGPAYNASLTIDEAGHAHLVYAGEGPEYLYYRRGEPAHHGWQWSIRVRIFDVPALASVNAVAHSERDEWKIHVVWSRGGEFASAYANSFKIDPEREIWLGTRERIGGPFDLAGHPAPALDLDPSTKRLWAAMWGGTLGAVAAEATYFDGRWKWSRPRPLGDPLPALEGSLSAVWAGDRLVVTYGSDDALVAQVPGADPLVAAGPAARTSVGVDAAGRVHVLYRGREPGPLFHRRLEADGWGPPTEVHPGSVASFSIEQHGGERPGALLAVAENSAYDVVALALE